MAQKGRISQSASRRAPAQYFTGKATMQEILKEPGDYGMHHVTFYGGARTKLHYHTRRQTLIVTAGEGSLVIYKRAGTGKRFSVKTASTTKISKGDVVTIPPRVLHTHGSVGRRVFSHIAVNSFYKRKPLGTVWYETDGSKVTGKI